MTSPSYGYAHRGQAVAQDATTGGWTVRCAALAPGRIMGPFPSMVAGLVAGDRVALVSVGTSRDDLLIIGRMPGALPSDAHRTVRRVQRADGASLGTSASTTPVALHTVALTGLTPNTIYRVAAKVAASSTVAADDLRAVLYKTSTAGTLLDSSTQERQSVGSADVHALRVAYDYRTGPSETAVTFVVAGYRAAGLGTVTFAALAAAPYQFEVTQVGTAFDAF